MAVDMNAWAVVAGAAVGGLLSGGAVLLSQTLQARQRRAEIRLQERVRDLRPLAAEIGAVTERVCGWGWSTYDDGNALLQRVRDIEDRAGVIWADPEARQMFRDWAQALRIVVDLRVRKQTSESQPIATEATEKAETLIARIEAMQSE